MTNNLINIIFGMKVRQARLETGLTLSEFASQCELSPSYVTEIEKGRKYPRVDKIMRMAEVLRKPYDDLVSISLSPSMTYLSTTLKSVTFQRFPFEEFGLEMGDLVTLLTREPEKASALMHAVLEIGRRYDLHEEDFAGGSALLPGNPRKLLPGFRRCGPDVYRNLWPGGGTHQRSPVEPRSIRSYFARQIWLHAGYRNHHGSAIPQQVSGGLF